MPFEKGNELSKLADHTEAGRKPKISAENRLKAAQAYGDSIVASTLLVRDLLLNKRWDAQQISDTQWKRTQIAWQVMNKYYPDAPKEVEVSAEIDHKGLPQSLTQVLVSVSQSNADSLETPSTLPKLSAATPTTAPQPNGNGHLEKVIGLLTTTDESEQNNSPKT